MRNHLAIAFFVSWLACEMCHAQRGEPVIEGALTFDILDGDLVVIDCDESAVTIEIPAFVRKYPVSKIGPECFAKCYSLESVTIPEGIIELGEKAFFSCGRLTTLILPQTIEFIGDNALEGCKAINALSLPSGLKTIGAGAFDGCSQLPEINIGPHLEALGAGAFRSCSELIDINANQANQHFHSDGGVLFSKDQKVLLAYPPGRTGSYDVPQRVSIIGENAFELSMLESVTLPEGLIEIGDMAFMLSNLNAVEFPATLVTLGESAFASSTQLEELNLNNLRGMGAKSFRMCSRLSEVKFGKNLRSIGEHAFSNCSSLEVLEINGDQLEIGTSAFEYCRNLKSVDFGDGVYGLGAAAFAVCDSLVNIYFGSSVQSIGFGAFNNCTALKEVEINSKTEWIGPGAFHTCKQLGKISVDKQSKVFSSIDGVLFQNNQSILHTFPTAKSGEYSVPDTVIEIGHSAFGICRDLSSVDLPAGLEKIGERAFIACDGLTSISLPKSLQLIGRNAFESCSWLDKVIIPDSCTFLGREAFKNCTRLAEVTLGKGLLSLPRRVFQGTSLSTAEIPRNVKRIEDEVFAKCYGLVSVFMHNEIEAVGDKVFYQCDWLKTVALPHQFHSKDEIFRIGAGRIYPKGVALPQIFLDVTVESIAGESEFRLTCKGIPAESIQCEISKDLKNWNLVTESFENVEGVPTLFLANSGSNLFARAFMVSE